MLEQLNRQLAEAGHLSAQQIRVAVEQLVDETVTAELKADFLCRLAVKGETVDEITTFARVLREKSVQPPITAETRKREILDVVGTGGDHLGTFNISTIVALICAAAGVIVAKHGNRAATSKCGSADVLEALGVRIDLPPEAAAKALDEHGFAFFFAPLYHPTFKHVSLARRICAERGQRTIFNFLGPLLNPANPSAALVGVAVPGLCEPLGMVLQSLGLRRGMVVCGRVENNKSPAVAHSSGNSNRTFLDELSIFGENTIAEFYQERGFTQSTMSAEHFPIQGGDLSDLVGGNRQVNAGIVRRILDGTERGPKRDVILLNAGAALFVAGRCETLISGWSLAASTIDSGQASQKLKQLTTI